MEVLLEAVGHVVVWFLYSMKSLAGWFCHADVVSGGAAFKATLYRLFFFFQAKNDCFKIIFFFTTY